VALRRKGSGVEAGHESPRCQVERVKSGQPAVVLESMRMHNEIEAPVDGVVRRINCKVGDQVGFGHVLAEIGAE
jgi:biotin carboxyl carrier protein